MASVKPSLEDIYKIIESLNVKELIELQRVFQEKWNISDNEIAGVSAQSTGSIPTIVEVEEEEATYNLVASAMKDPAKKIKCTIFLKNTFKLEMQKCKEILETLPNKPVIQQNISKEDAAKYIQEAAAEEIQLVLERVKA